MKRTIKLSALFVISAVLLSSCVTYNACRGRFPCLSGSDTTTGTITSYTPHDTLWYVLPDSSSTQVKVDCDSLKRAFVTQIANSLSGTHVKAPVLRKINNNTYEIVCKTDTNSLIKRWLEKNKLTTTKIINTSTPVQVHYLSWWDKLWRWLGIAFASLLGAGLIYLVIKIILKLK